jgi:Fe-S oxidoreductase
MDLARVKAIAVLGYNFNLHLLRSVFRRNKEDQKKLFLEYFKEDNITGLSEKEHRDALDFEGCVACGLCPASCRVMELSEGKFLGPMHIAASAGRSFPDLHNDADSIFLCAVCGQCGPACPEDVPIARIAASMRAMIWKVAPQAVPPVYQTARENLRAHGNIYGGRQIPPNKKGDTNTALVLGPFLQRHPEAAKRALAVLDKLGYAPALVEEGTLAGVAESMGLEPDTEWIQNLLPYRNIIVADPDLWLALKKRPELQSSRVLFITGAVEEKLDDTGLGGLVEGPVAVHDTAALARYSTVAADLRDLLRNRGVEIMPLPEEMENAPPLGWEGGLDMAAPDMTAKLVRSRLEEAEKAGARLLITPCFQDVAVCREHGGESPVRVEYLMDLFHKALCKE